MIRRKIRRLASGLMGSLCLTVFLSLCACEPQPGGKASAKAPEQDQSQEEQGPVLRIFDKNISGQKFDDAVAEKIMEKTGVRVELMDATGSPDAALDTMLMGGTYPDIILMEQGEKVNQFMEAGVFIPLDELIASYGPDITAMYGDILDKSRVGDGKLYWLANWYGKDTDASAGVLMRKDYLTELVGEERAESTEPFTLSEYTDLLRRFREKHPEVNGKEAIALDFDSDDRYYEGTLNGIFGMKSYGEDGEGSLQYLPATERYREAMLYLNSLYTEGLLCREWVIDRTEKWKSDLKSGAVFSTWCSYWDTDEVNAELKQKYGDEAQFFCYKVVADDLKETETTFNGRNSLGWDAIGITSSCQDPPAALRLLNYLASEEGQYLLLWGIEGTTWTMENGKHVPDSAFLKEWADHSTELERTTGVRRWKWTIKNGNGSDGTPYDLTTKYQPSELVRFANDRFLETDYWDKSLYSGLEPSIKSGLGLSWQKIEKLYKESFPRIICAGSREEAELLCSRMITDMEASGLRECEAYITEQYQNRLQHWTGEQTAE